MTALLKNRWAWTGAFWLAAVAIAVWNHQKIDAILFVEGQNHTVNQELVFQQQHGRRLARIQEEYGQLFLPVESVQLGVLSAKSAILELADTLAVAPPHFTVAPISKGDETAALSISLEGSFEIIALFLSEVTRLRYLTEKQCAIKVDPKSGQASCDLSVVLRCRLQDLPGETTRLRAETKSAL